MSSSGGVGGVMRSGVEVGFSLDTVFVCFQPNEVEREERNSVEKK